MRIRFTVAISTAICIALWFWYYPERPADAQQATLSHVIDLPRDQDWMSGFSGIDLNASGTEFHMVTDRGQIVKGILAREAGKLTSVEFKADQPLVDKNGQVPECPHTDAEGIAVDVQGRVFVSFEHAHRVLFYDTWESHARWPLIQGLGVRYRTIRVSKRWRFRRTERFSQSPNRSTKVPQKRWCIFGLRTANGRNPSPCQ